MAPSLSLEDLLVEKSSAPPPPPPSAGSQPDSDEDYSTSIPWWRWHALRGGIARTGQYGVDNGQLQSFPETWIWDSASSFSSSSSSTRTISPGPSDGYSLHHCDHPPDRHMVILDGVHAIDHADSHLSLSQQVSPERRETWQQALIHLPEWHAIERSRTAPGNFSPARVESREMCTEHSPRASIDSAEIARRHSLRVSTVSSAAITTSAPVRLLRRTSTVAEGLARKVSISVSKGVKKGTRKLSSGTRRVSQIFRRKDSAFDDEPNVYDWHHTDGTHEIGGLLGREIPLAMDEGGCPSINVYGRMSTRSDWREMEWQAGEHIANVRPLPPSLV